MDAQTLFLDQNVWDVLHACALDLCAEFPPHRYSLSITREAEFEIEALPSGKADLRRFIENTISRCAVRTDELFGFFQDAYPADDQRVAGFDSGRWIHAEERAFLSAYSRPGQGLRPTRLAKQEADVSLAARSFGSIVLTRDAKPGPLRTARNLGGRVVFLNAFEASSLSLRRFVEAQLAEAAYDLAERMTPLPTAMP